MATRTKAKATKARAAPKPKDTRKAPEHWKIEQVSRNVHSVRVALGGAHKELWVLLVSDEHWDNPHCRRDILERHHKEAVERKALILKLGDGYCAMQGKFDKRSDKGSVRPEHQEGDYLDSLVKTAADWFHPYSRNIGMIAQGNHETAIRSRHETDLVERLAERLRERGGITTAGGYSGWVRFQVTGWGNVRRSLRLFYAHGSGGGGPVTHGLIDYNRMAQYVDADILCAGHVHSKMVVPVNRMRLSDGNVLSRDTMHFVRCGTYKDEYDDGHGGYHIEKGRAPRPLGGYWMRLSLNRRGRAGPQTLKAEFHDAGE